MNRGLPIVVASYGKVMAAHWSAISVQHKCSMDTGLWHQLLKDVYVPLYEGRLSPEPIRDPVRMKLLSGPLIVKMDAGPRRLSKQAISIDFHEEVLDAKAKANAELKKTNDVLKQDGEAQKAHREWVRDGRLVNDDGNPKLNRKSAHAIVRFLLPRVDINGELKMKDLTQ